ncbi:hypothetical protein [Aquicella lusitana]|uniref:Uncharacterized protein n=1 Tax=Aquicella lusitana TaxID=254246 RepID=A0A370GFZ2_9COXI|nr:hypothetical protein [Aquicella lusitana]RDI42712.1 hypothetical protein C8D86_11341 [Aquicella lusitana]VVC73433.1 hypothetical protein AQULUS_11730 [Aquicella lusitana]
MSDTRTLGTRFRFAPSDIRDLIAQLARNEKAKGSLVTEMTLEMQKSASSSGSSITYYVIEQPHRHKKIITFPPSKDSGTLGNQMELPFIGDLLKQFLQMFLKPNQTSDAVLLVPVRQCRGVLELPVNVALPTWIQKWVQKRHIVLMEIDLASCQITMHDPQADFGPLLNYLSGVTRLSLYPDKMASILEELQLLGYSFQYQRIFYGKQHDNILCGPFNHQYLLSFHHHGNAAHFHEIQVRIGEKPKEQDECSAIVYVGNEDKSTYIRKFIPEWKSQYAPKHEAKSEDNVMALDNFDDLNLDECETALPIVHHLKQDPLLHQQRFFRSQSFSSFDAQAMTKQKIIQSVVEFQKKPASQDGIVFFRSKLRRNSSESALDSLLPKALQKGPSS